MPVLWAFLWATLLAIDGRGKIGVWKNTKYKSGLFNFLLIACRVCIHVLVNERQVKLLRKVHDGILFHSVMLFWKGPSQGKH